MNPQDPGFEFLGMRHRTRKQHPQRGGFGRLHAPNCTDFGLPRATHLLSLDTSTAPPPSACTTCHPRNPMSQVEHMGSRACALAAFAGRGHPVLPAAPPRAAQPRHVNLHYPVSVQSLKPTTMVRRRRRPSGRTPWCPQTVRLHAGMRHRAAPGLSEARCATFLGPLLPHASLPPSAQLGGAARCDHSTRIRSHALFCPPP
mmetsp:Transcript_21893/g.67960  ORF Transcript_21893/g.67960 Transcript_21893/m.67960 type:complete len:201 (+) Transcript_21893:340-942(+)